MKIKFLIEFDITEKRLLKLGFVVKRSMANGVNYVMGRYIDDCGYYNDQIIYNPYKKTITENWACNVGPSYKDQKVNSINDIKNFLEDITILKEKESNVIEGTFKIILKSPGMLRLNVLKNTKELLNLTLFDAKELIDNAPSLLKNNASKEEAMLIKKELESFGATIELQRN